MMKGFNLPEGVKHVSARMFHLGANNFLCILDADGTLEGYTEYGLVSRQAEEWARNRNAAVVCVYKSQSTGLVEATWSFAEFWHQTTESGCPSQPQPSVQDSLEPADVWDLYFGGGGRA